MELVVICIFQLRLKDMNKENMEDIGDRDIISEYYEF